jgi:hypothetical protein
VFSMGSDKRKCFLRGSVPGYITRVFSESSLESRRVSVGKILSRVGCSGTQAEEPFQPSVVL